MKRADKEQSLLEQLNINLDSINDQKIKETIQVLFNLLESQAATIRQLQEENQRLRDENNQLKGEQGKPRINPNKQKPSDISSEKERKENSSTVKRSSTKDKIRIDRTRICEIDKAQLPDDAEFKGYETVTIQDLRIDTANVEFRKEIYYSATAHKTFRGNLPAGYEGGFGPTVKAITLILKNICNVTEPKIVDFLHNLNLHISSGSIANLLIKKKDLFHQEKQDLVEAGLQSSVYQQIDDIGARVNGQNYYTHILCNSLYTVYFTKEQKDRLTIIKLLQNGSELKYCVNHEAIEIAKQLAVPQKYISLLEKLLGEDEYTRQQFTEMLNKCFGDMKEYALVKILEAAAIAYYHKGLGYPVVKILLCDEAPQFKIITEELASCWVHDGRLYKKLSPVVPHHVKELENFLTGYWQYYQELLTSKLTPSKQLADHLSEEFDKLFSTQTSYLALNERITKSKQKKAHLLLALKYPEIPLHNNAAELAARAQVRKRDVSLHTITQEGTSANDAFLTITQTCKKLGVNAYDYIFDRVTKAFNLPSLAQMHSRKIVLRPNICVWPLTHCLVYHEFLRGYHF